MHVCVCVGEWMLCIDGVFVNISIHYASITLSMIRAFYCVVSVYVHVYNEWNH